MKTEGCRYVEVPKLFHELFGKRTTKAELIFVLVTCLILSALLLPLTYGEWANLALWAQVLVILLTLDITGGVIANLTEGTDRYYRGNKKMRTIFIVIHIQPLLLGWLLGSFLTGLTVWAVTILLTTLIPRLKGGVQLSAGMAAAVTGILLLAVMSEAGFLLNALLSLYMVKLMFSFAVDHH